MNVLVHAGSDAGAAPPNVDRFAVGLVGALARRSDTRVTVLADARSLAPYGQLPSVQLVDQAGDSSGPRSLEGNDILVQLHQFQPRPIDVPTVVVVHDLDVYDSAWMYGAERAPLVRALHKNVIRADAAVSSHPYVVERLVEVEPLAAGKTVLTVAPPFAAGAEPDEGTVIDVRRRFALDDGPPTVVHPGPLLPNQNHWNLLTAVGEAQRSGRELRLLCVGDLAAGEWADAVRRRVGYLGLHDVDFPGSVSGAPWSALLRAVTGVVSTSPAAPGAVVAQEALLHDAAVACPATPGPLAHLDRLGLEVPTFDPYDVDAIAAALTRLIDDRDAIVGGYGKARSVVDEWSWDRLADEIVTSVEVAGS